MELFGLLHIKKVFRNGDDLSVTDASQFFCCSCKLIFMPRHQYQVMAVFGKTFRQFKSDTGTSAGNKGVGFLSFHYICFRLKVNRNYAIRTVENLLILIENMNTICLTNPPISV